MASRKKTVGKPSRKLWYWGAVPIVLVAAGAWVFVPPRVPEIKPAPTAASPRKASDGEVLANYAGSKSCKGCHQEAYEHWAGSHHALAERAVSRELDGDAFEPPHRIAHGSQISQARLLQGEPELVTMGLDGNQKPFRAERVLGVAPLRQFMVPGPGGRMQVSELAYDPHHPGWFDVYGEEDRKGGEWGHWTGRGMTWNSMCAACHNTRLRKNYDEPTDQYSTRMAEMGVGCEACHGPLGAHNVWQAKHPNKVGDPTVRRINREEMFAVCGSCHARRAELTGEFVPGESFYDHYALTIPDETDLFYPDGQVRDEDYELTAFLGSKMHAAGVRCVDCHEPHSSRTRVKGNDLCMICHAAPVAPAPKIDPATHSHHQVGERGDQCVNCHMPQTVYMQRHSRRDHGFTVPDPVLTREFNIPNACNRCHSERTADWSIAAIEKWYGKKPERATTSRARIIARARAGDRSAMDSLLGLLKTETNSLWRAVSANLLRRWLDDPRVTGALLSSAGDPDPLVRSMSIRALEPLVARAPAPVLTMLNNRLEDPVRLVRIDAAWALHATLNTNSPAGSDLLHYLAHSRDQPSGALQSGVFHLDRENLPAAISYFQRAVAWDPNSAPPRHALAIAFSLQGQSAAAVKELQEACRLAPGEAEFRYKLGLALNEVGKLEEARAALQEAVKLDPQFSQAWYNLGLAYNATGKPESALDTLLRAESLDSHSAQIPYARATILARLGRLEEARTAARRALEIQPAHQEAAGLLNSLQR